MEKKSKFKILTIIIFIFAVFVSLFSIIYVKCFLTETENFVTDLIVSNDNLTIKVGESVDLKNYYRVEPLNVSANVWCYIDGPSFAKIDKNNILQAESAGSTKICLKVRSGEDIIERNITLQIAELPKIPTKLSFDNEIVKLSINDSGIYNKLTITGEYDVAGEIKYSNTNICEYNLSTGEIIPLGEGETTVTVLFKSGTNTISKSFSVEIKVNMQKEIVLENITLENNVYSVEIPKAKNKQITISYKEDEVDVTNFDFEAEILSNTCELVCEKDKKCLRISVKAIGEAEIKISIKDKDIFVILKVKGVE